MKGNTLTGEGGEKIKRKKTLTDTLWDKIGRWCAVQIKNKPIKMSLDVFLDGLDYRELVKWKDFNLGWSRHNGMISIIAWLLWRGWYDTLAVRDYSCEWLYERNLKQLKRPHQKKRMVLEMGVNYVCQEKWWKGTIRVG